MSQTQTRHGMTQEELATFVGRALVAKESDKEFYTTRIRAHREHAADIATSETELNSALYTGLRNDIKRRLQSTTPAMQQPFTAIMHHAMEHLDLRTVTYTVYGICTAEPVEAESHV